jgi:hypothetical protein
MGRISKTLKIKGSKGTKDICVIFDSNATRTVIRKDVAKKFCNIIYFEEPKPIRVVDGKNSIKAIGSANFVIEIEDCEIGDSMHIVDKLDVDMIIGSSTLHIHKIKMIFDEEKGFKLDFSQCKKRVEYI